MFSPDLYGWTYSIILKKFHNQYSEQINNLTQLVLPSQKYILYKHRVLTHRLSDPLLSTYIKIEDQILKMFSPNLYGWTYSIILKKFHNQYSEQINNLTQLVLPSQKYIFYKQPVHKQLAFRT